MISAGIVGATGYAGMELLRILHDHPEVRVVTLTSRREIGTRVDVMFPHLRKFSDLTYSDVDGGLEHCDVVFFATPHGVAMEAAPALLKQGVRIIDLSADFRLRDPEVYRHWYKKEHVCPEILAESVYGLPEMNRSAIRSARVVGNPGCYPTSVQLGLLPLVEAGLVGKGQIIADCKSGASGAGREANVNLLFCEAGDSLSAYKVAGHRHSAEMEQGLAPIANGSVGLIFVPHLVPMIRGIHATLYAPLANTGEDLQALFERRYASEQFVDVLPEGSHPETRSVRGTNFCRIAVHCPGNSRTAVMLVVIDNLVKGAAGQAVQCLNLMFGLDECCGLMAAPLWP